MLLGYQVAVEGEPESGEFRASVRTWVVGTATLPPWRWAMTRLVNRTHNGRIAAVLIIAAGIWAAPRQARAQDVEVRPWSEILIVVGHNVGLSLPDAYVEGEALAVTSNALELDVEKTSNAAAYPKGRVTIARSLVSVIRLRKGDGRAPRVASQTIGQAAVVGGLAAGFGGFGSRNGIRGSLKSAGVQIGAAALGSAIGRRLDDRDVETLIRIAPEPGAADGASPPVARSTTPSTERRYRTTQ
jgi:hypothetical protein